MNDQIDKELLTTRLIEFEGMVLHAYQCPAGYTTLGVGRNIDTNGVGITEEEALYLLRHDIDRVVETLDLKWKVWRTFPLDAQHVCIDLVFNMGMNTFMSFRKTRSYMELGEWECAAEELLDSKYAKQVGRRALFNADQLTKCQKNHLNKKIQQKD
jgi:lysozyme